MAEIGRKNTAVAFDVYGTLIDPASIARSLEKNLKCSASAFSDTWRAKQLEYTFRRGLMRRYVDFDVCTSQALDYCCALFEADLSSEARHQLLDQYQRLPAYDDVASGLDGLVKKGCRLYTLSNGHPKSVRQLLKGAGLEGYFRNNISVHDVQSFKPDPLVYRHLLMRENLRAADAWLVSGNPFDVIGAEYAGLKSVWIRRDPGILFDPWNCSPTATISSIAELPAVLNS